MYYYKDKKYALIMKVKEKDRLISYKVMKTDVDTLGWETLNVYDVYEIGGKMYIDEEMIRLINCLIFEGYEFLGKKEKY